MMLEVIKENEGLRMDLRREQVTNSALKARNVYLCNELDKAWSR